MGKTFKAGSVPEQWLVGMWFSLPACKEFSAPYVIKLVVGDYVIYQDFLNDLQYFSTSENAAKADRSLQYLLRWDFTEGQE